MSEPVTSETPLPLDLDMLRRLGELCAPHGHNLLTDIRKQFGDDSAATLYTIGLFMMCGSVLNTIPNAERAPDGVAAVWSLMRVPFTLEAKGRVQ